MAITEKATVEVQVNGQEAAKELERLSKRAEHLKDALAKAQAAGDAKKVKQLNGELKAVSKEMATLKRNIDVVNSTMGNLSAATPKEIRKAIKAINQELNSGRVKRGSEEWNQYTEALRRANAELKKIKEETDVAQQSLASQVADFTQKWWSFYDIATNIANNVYSFASSKVQAFAQMDEAMSQVTKYTGMARDEVKGLNEDFKKMDTRTAREQLNALAGDAGRLGIQAKDQVLEFVDAADKINVALGEDLGEDAVKNIGKLAMMFGEDKTKGMRAAMLATGSAVNEVAQNCSAAEPFLVNFTARVAGAAHQAGIAQADILGFAASMDENMLREETSATAYQNILMKMYTSTEKFADAAGIELQTFSDLLRTDANEALLQFAEGLSSRGGLAELAPIFGDLKTEGAGVAAVLSVMAGKADEIRARQALANKAYQEGTSILKEFDVQNNTVQAGLDKAKKRANDLAVELGERLQPIMANGLHLTSLATKALIATIDFVNKYKTTILTVTTVLVAYHYRLKALTAVQTAWNTLVRTTTILTNTYRLANIALNSSIAGDRRALLQFGRQLMSTNVLTKTAAAGTMLLRAAYGLLSLRINESRQAMKGFIAITRSNPLGLILTAVAAATAGWIAYKRSTDSATKAQRNLVDLKRQAVGEVQEEVAQMQSLLSIARDVNLSYDTRKGAIDKLNEILPDHLENLSMETINSSKAQEAVDKHTQALIRQATIQAQLNRLGEINANMAKYGGDKTEYLRREVNVFELLWSGATQGTAIPQWEEWVAEKKLIEEELKKLQTEELAQTGGGAGGGDDKKCPVCGNKPCTCNKDKVTDEEVLNAKLKAEELRHQNELADLKRAYLANDTMTRERYLRLSEDLEIEHLKRQLDIAGLEPEKKAAIIQKILDARIKFQEDCAKETEQQNKEAQEKALTQREKQYQLEVEEATSKHYREMTSEAEFLQQLADMELAYYQDMLANYELTEEQKDQFQQKIRENRLQQEEADYQKRKEQQEKDRALVQKYTDIAKSVASDYGTTIGEMIADGELTMKNFLKETLLMSVDALEKVVEICVVEVMARNLAATAPFSFIGAAKAALQIAAIKAGFAVVKGLIGNFYTGGYTGGGAWDEPKGVVHSNEFVANRFAVANPSVRPVLDLINQAQRNNTISTLSAVDISRVLPGAGGTQTVVVQNDNPELMRLIAECSQAVGTLQNRLKYPIKAVTSISGRDGVKKGLDDYDTLLNNKSR